MSTLPDTLQALASQLGLDADELIAYANEDTIGGYHSDANQAKWPVGSLWEVEGQTLYALVRALKPDTILELGTHRGCSTTHLATAVMHNGNGGKVIAVDIWEGAGDLIPAELFAVVNTVYADAIDVIEQLSDNSVQFVFEDLLHGSEQVAAVIEALKPKLASRAVVVHHDSEHGDDGAKIRRGIEMAGITEYVSQLTAPSDCGLAVWRGETKAIEPERLLSPETLAKLRASDLFKDEPPPTKKPAPVKKTPAKKQAASRKTAVKK